MTFIEKLIAKLQGKDDAQVNAEKIVKKIKAMNAQQTAALQIRKMELEQELEDANEELEDLKHPLEVPTNVKDFYNAIKRKLVDIADLQDELDAVNDSLLFIENYDLEISNVK